MLVLYSFVFVALFGYTNACSCPQFIGQDQLRKDPVYKICHNHYLTRIKLSKLENYTCVQDPLKNQGCYMKTEVIEDFFAPLNEADRLKPTADKLVGDLNGPLCGVSLPKPGDYIMNARVGAHSPSFRENSCDVLREPYTEQRAAEIRELVKKCPKERRDFGYWSAKGLELAMPDLKQATEQ